MRRTGRCLSYGRGITYWPLAEVIKEHFGIARGRGAGARPRAARRATRSSASRSAWTSPAACIRSSRATGCTTRRRASSRSSPPSGPLVLLVEDLHWAEEELLDLRRPAAGGRDTARCFLHRDLPAGDARRATRRGAAASGTSRARARAADRAPDRGDGLGAARGRTARAACAQALVERAERKPVLRRGARGDADRPWRARAPNGGWTADELPAGFEIPTRCRPCSRRGSTCCRAGEKAALQAASVIGRVFWTARWSSCWAALSRATSCSRSGISSVAARARRFAGEREFAIKHALTREVAYASLPKARRAPAPRLLRRLDGALRRGRDEHAADPRPPLRRGCPARGRRSRVGRGRGRARASCAGRRSQWLERARISQSGATRSTTV